MYFFPGLFASENFHEHTRTDTAFLYLNYFWPTVKIVNISCPIYINVVKFEIIKMSDYVQNLHYISSNCTSTMYIVFSFNRMLRVSDCYLAPIEQLLNSVYVSKNQRSNQKLTIQRNWQQWVHKTQNEDKQNIKHNTEY
jgi:hypothetical protein